MAITAEPVVIREGASLRTADELCALYLDDAVSLGAELSPYGEDVRSRVAAALGMSAWLDDADLSDELRTVTWQVESELSGLGYVTEWDDGYSITPVSTVPAGIRYVALWHGGANYGAPYAEDAEMFGSIDEAADAMRSRRDLGHHYPQTARYVFREDASLLTPCAHEDNSGHTDLYRVDSSTTAEDVREMIESGNGPTVRLVIGPRGGIVRN